MKRMVFVLVVFAVTALTTGNIFAQGEATGEFLLIAPGARAGGIGEANVALANDAYATYWNPAGLALLKGKEFSGMHASWLPQFNFGDMYYDFASYTHHFEGIGTFGLNAIYLTLGEQERRDENNNYLGTFDSFQLATGVSYGTQLSDNLSVGSTFKFIYMKLTDSQMVGAQQTDGTGTGFALDFGALYTPDWFSRRLTFGANLMNLGPKITFVDAAQADPIPTNLKAGFTFRALEGEFNKLLFTTEINKLLVRKYNDDNGDPQSDPFYKALFTSWSEGGLDYQIKRMSWAGGAEYWYGNYFSLRGGYFYEDIGKRRFATFGAGIRYNIYQFDFGYIAGEEDHPLSQTMRFSLSFIFGSR